MENLLGWFSINQKNNKLWLNKGKKKDYHIFAQHRYEQYGKK